MLRNSMSHAKPLAAGLYWHQLGAVGEAAMERARCRRFCDVCGTSALPPILTVTTDILNRQLRPEADIRRACSFTSPAPEVAASCRPFTIAAFTQAADDRSRTSWPPGDPQNVTRFILVYCVTGSLIVVHSEPRSSGRRFPALEFSDETGSEIFSKVHRLKVDRRPPNTAR
jgi:hypothetical protein